MLGKKTVLITCTVLLGSFLFRTRLETLFESCTSLLSKVEGDVNGIFSSAQLAEYDGRKKDKLYLALMGVVYDVTEGKRHYSKGAPYHYFVGKDGSRAFITGNFQDESSDKDHVLNLSCNELFNLVNWKNTLKEKYRSVVHQTSMINPNLDIMVRIDGIGIIHAWLQSGLLIGRFYDEKGKQTEYSRQFDDKMAQCEIERESEKKENAKLPPCNMEWTSSEGTRVWCTKTSGGVTRSWAGVPRQFYSPGGGDPRCVCINPNDNHSSTLLKLYENCLDTSSSCYFNS